MIQRQKQFDRENSAKVKPNLNNEVYRKNIKSRESIKEIVKINKSNDWSNETNKSKDRLYNELDVNAQELKDLDDD